MTAFLNKPETKPKDDSDDINTEIGKSHKWPSFVKEQGYDTCKLTELTRDAYSVARKLCYSIFSL
jgi:hypothetical protein